MTRKPVTGYLLEFQAALTNKNAKLYGSACGMTDVILILALIICIVAVFYVFQKNKRFMKIALQKQDEGLVRYEAAIQLSEKGIRLNEDTNKLLKEILEVLKSKN